MGDEEALGQIAARLKNAAAIHHESLGEKAFIQVSELVEDLRHKHPKEIDCPDCGNRLDAKAAISPGGEGLVGMACPHRHGAWIDQNMLAEIRKRLDIAAGVKSKLTRQQALLVSSVCAQQNYNRSGFDLIAQ